MAASSKGIYSAGTAFLSVVPSFLGVEQAFENELKKVGRKLDAKIEGDVGRGLNAGARRATKAGDKAAADFYGAFGRRSAKSLKATADAIPMPEPGDTMRRWDKALLQVRKDVQELGREKIGFTIDEETAFAAVKSFRERLRTLEESAPKATGFFNARAAGKELDDLISVSEEARRRGAQAGEAYGDSFTEKVQTSLDRGLRAVRPVQIDADTSAAEQRLQELRKHMLDLKERIGVDLDAGEAYAKIKAIETLLRQLDSEEVDVRVRANAREAATGFGQLRKEVEGGSDALAKMEKVAGLTMSRLQYIIAYGASLGSVFVPGALSAAAALGAMGSASIAGVSGLGVLALGTNGLGDAVKALNEYEKDQLKSRNSINQANRSLTGSTDGVRQAEMSLSNARRHVDEQSEDAARRVKTAIDGVGEARREAALAARDAARDEQDAQRDLTEAEADARKVRLDLNEAYREAKRDMADLESQIKNNAIDQRKATTDILQAREELDKILSSPRATEIERRNAQESYDERVLQLEDLKRKGRELGEDQATANAKGLEGSSKVAAAKEKIADADKRTADAQRRLQEVQDRGAEQQLEAKQRIAKAQSEVDDARRQQLRQQRDGEYQLAQAAGAVASAQRTQQQAWEKTGLAGGDALTKLNQEMDSLAPSAQRFARFLFGLKDEAIGLRDVASDNMLPGFQEAITELLPLLPGVSRFVGLIAGQLGDMAVQGARAFKTDTWQDFFGFVERTAIPMLQRMFDIGMNVAEGLASVLQALEPFNDDVGDGLVKMSRDFADWAAALDRSEGFQDFLDYVRENGPQVVEFLGELGELFIDLVKALMPVGDFALATLTLIADGLNSIPQPVLTFLIAGIAAVSLGIAGLGTLLRARKFKDELAGIFGREQQNGVKAYVTHIGDAKTVTIDLGNEMAKSGDKSKVAAGKVGGLRGAMSGVKTAGIGAAAFLGGPWGIALEGALVLAGLLAAKTHDYNAEIDDMVGMFDDLGDRYKALERIGQNDSGHIVEAIQDIVGNNHDMQDTVKVIDDAGISFTQLGKAAAGSREDVKAVIDALDMQIKLLSDKWRDESNFLLTVFSEDATKTHDQLENARQIRDALVKHAAGLDLAAEAQKRLNSQNERHIAMAEIIKNNPGMTEGRLAGLAGAWDTYQGKIGELNRMLAIFRDGEGGTAAKVEYLRQKIDEQNASMRGGIEATEGWNYSFAQLKTSVDANGRSLSDQTDEGTANRNAIKGAAAAAQELFLQEVAAGGKLPEVTAKHKDRITALKEEAAKLFGAREKTDELIDVYGDIPEEVKTTFTSEDFAKAYAELDRLNFMQQLIQEGIVGDQAIRLYQERERNRRQGRGIAAGSSFAGFAAGGPVNGPGTGTSDSFLIRASDDEHMLTAEEVSKAGGHDKIYAWRKYILRGGDLPGYAVGGAVGARHRPKIKAPVDINLKKFWEPSLDEAQAFALGMNGGVGAPTGDGSVFGSPAMTRLMKAAISGLSVVSDYRPGDPGYHGKPPAGRAIDMVFSDGSERHGGGLAEQAFNYIASHYGKKTKELIWDFSPWGLSTGVWNGERHRFHSATSGPGSHDDHLHWAYDEGGWLKPGIGSYANFTGQPEAVLNPRQWQAIEQFVNVGMANGGGDTHNHYDFANSTLTPERMRAEQQRTDAVNRVNRPR